MGACVSRSRGATEFNHKDFKKALSNIDKKATKIVRLDPTASPEPDYYHRRQEERKRQEERGGGSKQPHSPPSPKENNLVSGGVSPDSPLKVRLGVQGKSKEGEVPHSPTAYGADSDFFRPGMGSVGLDALGPGRRMSTASQASVASMEDFPEDIEWELKQKRIADEMKQKKNYQRFLSFLDRKSTFYARASTWKSSLSSIRSSTRSIRSSTTSIPDVEAENTSSWKNKGGFFKRFLSTRSPRQ